MPFLWSVGGASVWLVSASLPLLGSPEHRLGAVLDGRLLTAPESLSLKCSSQGSVTQSCFQASLLDVDTDSKQTKRCTFSDVLHPWLLLGWAGRAGMRGQTHSFFTGVFPGSCRLQHC